jgi:hypothetical protein
VTPATTTTYTLTANSLGGELTAQTTVTVVPSSPRTFQYFRFLPLALRTAAANSIQLSEFELLDASQSPLPVATVTNPGGDNPAGENVENVIDGSVDTKWLDFLKGPLEFDFGSPVAVETYRFATANDAAERDPISWRLEGSTDGLTWEIVHEVIGFSPPISRKTYTYAFPLPPGGFPPRIDFRVSRPISPPGTPLVLYWDVVGALNVSIDQGIGAVDPVGSQPVTPAGPTTYTLTASNSASTQSATASASFASPSPVTYQYFRFTPVQLRNDATANSVQLSEFTMSNAGADVLGATATNPGGNNPANETPDLAVDGNTATKWLDFLKGPLVLDFGTPVTVDGYYFTTANDATERDPIAWTLEGSADGTNWTLIDSQDQLFPPDERFTPTEIFPTLVAGPGFPPFAITSVSRNGATNEISLTWQSVAGAHYDVQASATLAAGGWTTVLPGVTSQGASTTAALPGQTQPARYYRVRRID